MSATAARRRGRLAVQQFGGAAHHTPEVVSLGLQSRQPSPLLQRVEQLGQVKSRTRCRQRRVVCGIEAEVADQRAQRAALLEHRVGAARWLVDVAAPDQEIADSVA